MKKIEISAFRSCLLNAYVGLASVVLVFPLVIVLLASFDSAAYISFPPQGFTLRWYEEIWSNPTFRLAFWNSLTVGIASTSIAVVTGVPAALLIARQRFFGRNFLYALFLSSLTIPWIVFGASLLVLWSMIGLNLSIQTQIFGHAIIGAPYVLRTSVAVLSSISPEYERAARSLGAGPLTAFMTITFPMMQPGVRAGAAFAFVISIVNVPVSLFVTTSQNITMPVAIFNYMQFNFDPSVAAFSVIQMIVVAIFVMTAVRAAYNGAIS